jgi:large subunit ribosomal protein L10
LRGAFRKIPRNRSGFPCPKREEGVPNKRNIALLAALKENLERAKGSFFLVNYQGLSAKETHALRQALKEKGARLFVAKNTLIRIALEELGLPKLDGLSGPSAVVFYQDPVAAAKALQEFSKKNPRASPRPRAGFCRGRCSRLRIILALAELPTMDELRAELVGVLQAPMAELVGVLGGVARELVGILEAYAEKKAA